MSEIRPNPHEKAPLVEAGLLSSSTGLAPLGLKERRQTRLLNTDPQVWLHSAALNAADVIIGSPRGGRPHEKAPPKRG